MPLRNPPTRVVLAAPLGSARLLAPSLFWPASWWTGQSIPSSDLIQFPNQAERAQRRSPKRLLASVEFRLALRTARRLWILDPYFDGESGTVPLAEALWDSSIRELRINGMGSITQSQVQEEINYLQEILKHRVGHGVIPDVEWRNTLSIGGDFVLHDRFAIVDDELWHFGATVGGTHRSINAFSRGWSATDTGAVSFFQQLWDSL
jgi:hypothetical protein